MKIFFDTEFIEDGKTIDLISIGAVRQDGSEFYLENIECNYSKSNQWVVDNVLPNLSGEPTHRKIIAEDFKQFCGDSPEFWAYYASYDWVVLCQLYGKMIDLPKGWPMYCNDLKQLIDFQFPHRHIEQTNSNHNALQDAKWIRDTYMSLWP